MTISREQVFAGLPTGSAPSAVCILGMHRSGTSALAGMLNLLGVDFGADLLPPGPDNPKGFWEHGHIVTLHIGLLRKIGSWTFDAFPLPERWEHQPAVGYYREYLLRLLRNEFGGKPLWGVKDPRTCRLVPLWREVFSLMGVNPLYVLMMRDPLEVSASLKAREGLDWTRALLLSLGYVLDLERYTRGHKRVVVHYGRLLADWQREARRIQAVMGVPWENPADSVSAQVQEFLDPNLRHSKVKLALTPQQAAGIPGECPQLAYWTYEAYNAMTADPSGSIDEAAMDRIFQQFNAAKPNLLRWRIPPDKAKVLHSYPGAASLLNR